MRSRHPIVCPGVALHARGKPPAESSVLSKTLAALLLLLPCTSSANLSFPACPSTVSQERYRVCARLYLTEPHPSPWAEGQ